jgi:hypothetical protein
MSYNVIVLWCYCAVEFLSCDVIVLWYSAELSICSAIVLFCCVIIALLDYCSTVLFFYLILSYCLSLFFCRNVLLLFFCLIFSAPVGSQTTGSTLAILPTVHLPIALCAAPTVASTHTATAISAPFSLTTWSAANHPATPTFIPSPSSHPLLPLPNHIISQLSRN